MECSERICKWQAVTGGLRGTLSFHVARPGAAIRSSQAEDEDHGAAILRREIAGGTADGIDRFRAGSDPLSGQVGLEVNRNTAESCKCRTGPLISGRRKNVGKAKFAIEFGRGGDEFERLFDGELIASGH